MFCPACGTNLTDPCPKTCPTCGTALDWDEPEAPELVAAGPIHPQPPQGVEAQPLPNLDAKSEFATPPPQEGSTHDQDDRRMLPNTPGTAAPTEHHRTVPYKGTPIDVGFRLMSRWHQLPRRAKVAGGVALAVAIGGGIGLAVADQVSGGPSEERIEQDIRDSEDLRSPYGGMFGSTASLEVSSVKVTNKERGQEPRRRKKTYDVEADVTLEDEDLTESGTVELTYTGSGTRWNLLYGPTFEGSPSITPKKGPDEEQIKQGLMDYLELAGVTYEALHTGERSESVDEVLKRADLNVTKNEVDGTKASVTLHVKASASAYDLEGDVNVTLSFGRDGWQATKATADKGVYQRNFSKLKGSWTGTFESGTSPWAFDCFGGRGFPLSFKIDEIDPKTQKAKGTFSGLAHYHDKPRSDSEQTEGDTQIKDRPFEGVINDDVKYVGSKLGITVPIKDGDKRDLVLRIGFGTSEDPGAVVGALETGHHFSDSTSSDIVDTYRDTFKMTRAK